MTMDKVYLSNRSSSMATSSRPINSNGFNGSVNSLASRLPQRRESKIPGPHNQPTATTGCTNYSGITSSLVTSCQSLSTTMTMAATTATNSSSYTPVIGAPKKFLNPPSKLLTPHGTGLTSNRNDSSLRSVSPTTVFKCKSTQSHLIVPSSTLTTGSVASSPSMCNINSPIHNNQNNSGNSNDTNRGIRPPRLNTMSSNVLPATSPVVSTSATGKSLVTVNRSHITRHSVVNSGLATVGRSGSSMQNHHRSVTLREVKEDETTRRAKTPSSSISSLASSSPLRSVNNGDSNSPTRPSTGNPNLILNGNRSDSTPSLTENDSGSERKTLVGGNKSFTRTHLTKGLVGGAHGIPLPKSRPTSVCLDNSPMNGPSVITSSSSNTTVSHKTSSMSCVNNSSLSKSINKSVSRPLSSSGIPKTGISGHRNSTLNPKMSEESPKSEVTSERGRRATIESHLVPTRSEPNVARVSPIRRSIGQNINGDIGPSRFGTILKEESNHHHQPHSSQHHQCDKKMDENKYLSSTVPSSSNSNTSANVTVPTSISSPTPQLSSSISSSFSSLSASSSTSTSTTTTTTTTLSTPSTPTVTTPTSFASPLIHHQLPLGLSSVSRASEPMLPNLSPVSTSDQRNFSLKSVVEESLPIKARSTLSLSSNGNQSLKLKDDDYPRIKKIDLSGNVISYLESSRSISGSCDRISSNCALNGDTRALNSSISSKLTSNFSPNLLEPSPSHSNGYMSPLLEDDCSSPSRQSMNSPIESPYNQTIIERNGETSLSPSAKNGITNLDHNHDNSNQENDSSLNSNSLSSTITTVPSANANNLLNKINRCIKCTLPSEAELSLKTDLRFNSNNNNNNNGLTGCSSTTELTSYGANGCGNLILPTTPPPLQSSSQLPPPPFILQSAGLGPLTNQIKRLSKNGELRGSTISLLSGSSSFSATEERHNQEVKKLRDDLNRANSKVETLTQQLKNSNDMTQTFGKILETLRSRLYQCSLATDQKDREIARLKTTIEVLRRECAAAAGVTGNGELPNGVGGGSGGNSSCYGSSSDIECRRDKNKKRSHKEPRSPSCDRDTINSGDSSGGPSGWFKGSIQRAFKKNRSRNKSGGSITDVEATINKLNSTSDSSSLPSTPFSLNNKSDPFVELNSINGTNGSTTLSITTTTNGSTDLIIKDDDLLIKDLKKQLRDKEKQLNDIRLEVLLTASQTESLNDRISKMNKEMSALRTENHRLQCLLLRQSSIG